MENDLKHALGDAPNSEFIINPQGKVVVRHAWSNPTELRSDLERLVGVVDQPTSVADLKLRAAEPPRAAKTGVVPRIKMPGQMQALKIEPSMVSLEPFYVKLRAEAESSLIRSGAGKLYLGFHLDPLYEVHWNNLAAPLTFEVQALRGMKISPLAGAAPKVEVETDGDPREFLLDIEAAQGASSFEVIVKYFACHDQEGWCKPVTQQYRIYLEVDRDGGSARRGGRPMGRGNRPGRGPLASRAGGANRLMGMVFRVNVESRVVTLRMRDGGQREIFVPKEATIRRNDRPAALSELQRRNRIMIELDGQKEDDQGRPHAKRLMTRSG